LIIAPRYLEFLEDGSLRLPAQGLFIGTQSRLNPA
jgi:hypothetical protein